MPYTPSSADLDQAESELSQKSNSTVPIQQNNAQQSLLSRYMNTPGPQAVLGAGDSLRNTIASGLNLLPGVNISPVNSGNNGMAYNLGSAAGNIGGFMGGGEALDAARLASAGLPYIGRAAQALSDIPGSTGLQSFLPQMARQGIGAGIYGGLATDQNRAANAAQGAGISAGLSALPYGAGKIAQGAQYFMPQKYATNIINTLGNGQTLSDATKSVLADVKNSYETQVENAKNAYDPIFSAVSNRSIYAPVKRTLTGTPDVAPTNISTVNRSYSPINYPLPNNAGKDPTIFGTVIPNAEEQLGKNLSSSTISSGIQNPASFLDGAYPNLPKNITDNYTSGLKDLHDNFINNPTFQNAHKLQSELGSVSSQLQSGVSAPTISTINTAQSLMGARTALKSDINSFLMKQNPDLAQQYQNASENFQQNVVPYRTNPKIYSIATGDTTNVKPNSLANIFAAPDADLHKVISDLPSGSVDKILYTKLGQTVPNKSAQGLLNSYQNLQQQGLGDYVSPQLSAQLGDLENRIKARTALQMGTAGLAAATLGGHHLGSTAGAILGMGAGAVASPFMNYIARRLPQNIGSSIASGISGAYPYAQSALLSNYLNKSGGQNNGS
jgi:hypothetical protein